MLARTADLNAANATLLQEKERQITLIRKLEEAQSHLLQSERMVSIGQLAAGVAHEINNPVAFVNSNLGSLQRYVMDLLRLLMVYETTETSLPEEQLAAIRQVKNQVDFSPPNRLAKAPAWGFHWPTALCKITRDESRLPARSAVAAASG